MKQTKIISALRNVFGTVILGSMVGACGGGETFTASADSAPPPMPQAGGSQNFGTLSASNIILNRKTSNNMIRIQANQLPPNVQVLASQVTVVKDTNNQESTDLQTVMDTELVVDLATNIVGVWEIRNYSTNLFFRGPVSTGRVEFKSDGTFVVLSGGLATAGSIAKNDPKINAHVYYSQVATHCGMGRTEFTYEVIDGAIYFKLGDHQDPQVPLHQPPGNSMNFSYQHPPHSMTNDSLATVSRNTATGITMTTARIPCGEGGQAISRLTRVSPSSGGVDVESNRMGTTPKNIVRPRV